MRLTKWACLGGVSGLVLTAGLAHAGISDVIFSIRALSDRGAAEYTVRAGDVDLPPGAGALDYTSGPLTLRDAASGETIATLGSLNLRLRTGVESGGPADGADNPQIFLNFAVQAGAADTEFMITSAQLVFPALSNVAGRASAAITVTDGGFDGARLTGLHAGDGGARAFLAYYNGVAPTGTAYSRLINLIESEPASSFSANENDPPVGRRSVAGAVGDMSTMLHFSLSSGDSASGTTNFELVPEPSALLLMTLAVLGLRRR